MSNKLKLIFGQGVGAHAYSAAVMILELGSSGEGISPYTCMMFSQVLSVKLIARAVMRRYTDGASLKFWLPAKRPRRQSHWRASFVSGQAHDDSAPKLLLGNSAMRRPCGRKMHRIRVGGSVGLQNHLSDKAIRPTARWNGLR